MTPEHRTVRRAACASVTHDVVLPLFLVFTAIMFLLAMSSWAMRGFSIVGAMTP